MLAGSDFIFALCSMQFVNLLYLSLLFKIIGFILSFSVDGADFNIPPQLSRLRKVCSCNILWGLIFDFYPRGKYSLNICLTTLSFFFNICQSIRKVLLARFSCQIYFNSSVLFAYFFPRKLMHCTVREPLFDYYIHFCVVVSLVLTLAFYKIPLARHSPFRGHWSGLRQSQRLMISVSDRTYTRSSFNSHDWERRLFVAA